MLICLTNDDGIQAAGLRALYHALRADGHEIRVVAPYAEQSAVGHAITVRTPLQIKEVTEADFSGTAVLGTPADCVKLAFDQLLAQKPDLVISGINLGANVGPDIMYSGTVAAAREAASHAVPALAVSLDSYRATDFTEQAGYVCSLIRSIPWQNLPPRRVINCNFPNLPLAECKGLRLCPQTHAVWRDWYVKKEDPRGTPYWWLDGDIPPETIRDGDDRDSLSKGWITLTPLRFDFTDHDCLAAMREFLPEAG